MSPGPPRDPVFPCPPLGPSPESSYNGVDAGVVVVVVVVVVGRLVGLGVVVDVVDVVVLGQLSSLHLT